MVLICHLIVTVISSLSEVGVKQNFSSRGTLLMMDVGGGVLDANKAVRDAGLTQPW